MESTTISTGFYTPTLPVSMSDNSNPKVTHPTYLSGDAVSPMSRIPNEMVSEIFMEYVLAVVHEVRFGCLSGARGSIFAIRDAPLLLSSVCGDWRKLATSTPQLWTRIILVVHPHDADFVKEAEILKAFVGRAASLPLLLHIRYSRGYTVDDYVSDHTPVRRVVELIIPFASRLKGFRADLPQSAFELILSSLHGDTKLETLFLGKAPLYPSQPSSMQFHISSVPMLECLNLSAGVNIIWNTATNLRSITIQRSLGWTTGDTFLCLSHCPRTECLDVFIKGHSDLSEKRVLKLPRLSRLTLTIHKGVEVSVLLDLLALPALQELRANWNYPGPDTVYQESNPWSHLRLLLERSASPLTFLSLCNSPLSVEEFLGCLRQTPLVTSLLVTALIRPIRMNDILLALTRPSTTCDDGVRSFLCPCLETIYMRTMYTMSFAHLKQMILSRWSPGPGNGGVPGCTSLSNITFNRCCPRGFRKDPEIAQCIAEGMVLEGYPGWDDSEGSTDTDDRSLSD